MPVRLPTRGLLAIIAIAVAACASGVGTAAAAERPADEHFADQWALQPGAPLDGPAAWRIARGAGEVVAVVDSGVDTTHPDLAGALWTNSREVPGNGRDDDRNGHVDDVHGVDLVDHDGNPEDRDGHGTHVAGIIAAQLDGAGVVGLAPEAKIMAVRVLDTRTSGTADVVAAGIRYAVAHGATIINTSLSADRPDTSLDAAVQAARAAGVIVVASAGNDGRDLDLLPVWPAAAPGVLAAAASDQRSLLAAFSNFGPNTVDLAAPGTRILSTARGGGYELRSGTSMSAPALAAAVALVRSAAPGIDETALRELLVTTARRPRGLLGRLQAGQLDPVAALRRVAPTPLPLSVAARVKRRAAKRALVSWKLIGDSGGVSSFRITGSGGRKLATKPAGARGAWVSRRHRRVRVTARDAAGQALAAATVRLR